MVAARSAGEFERIRVLQAWGMESTEEINVLYVFLKSKSRITIFSVVFMISEVLTWPVWFIATKLQSVCCEYRSTRLIRLRR